MKKLVPFLVILVVLSISFPLSISILGQSSINFWFAPEQGKQIESKIENLIGSAEESIYIAVYDINDENLVNDLLSAHQKGIDVRVIMDNEEAEHEWDIVSPLDSKNILRTDHSKSNFMHNKFMVIDGIEVWTGSTNWTENGLFYNNNNSILIDSEKLADDYTTEFDEMWNGEFGVTSPENTPYPDVTVGDTHIQCYFAPEDHVEEHIVSEIENAKSSIDFATFTFTSIPIADAIIKKMDQGVTIRGIYEARQKSQWCTYDDLKEAGANVIYDKNPKTMHNKVFIIDGKTVITGSYNPTKHANTANDENVLIIKDSSIAEQYEKEFNNLFYEWGGSGSITPPLPPQNLQAAASINSITLAWSPSTQGAYPIAGYVIYRGTIPGGKSDIPITTVDANTTTYTDTSVEPGNTYCYIVKAFDSQNPPDYSASSNEVSVTIEQLDTTPPTVTIDTPVNFETVNTDTITVSGKVTDDKSGVDTVIINGNMVTLKSDKSFSTIVSLTKGNNVIKVVATDKVGNKTTKTIVVMYNPAYKPGITLQPDNPYMTVNGVKQEIDPGRGTKPVIIPKWGRTVVPIRAIAEAFGGKIEWDGTERKVTINFNGTTIELWIDKPQASVNGITKWIDPNNHDVKPIIINDRTMLPLRFVAESLGCTVGWDPDTRTITITYGG